MPSAYIAHSFPKHLPGDCASAVKAHQNDVGRVRKIRMQRHEFNSKYGDLLSEPLSFDF